MIGKLLDTEYDEVLKSNYELYSVKFSELQKEVKSWYQNIELEDFDKRTEYLANRYENEFIVKKIAAITSNYFYFYRDKNGKLHLMDGYNRLLTNYGKLPFDPIVNVKVLIDNLSDSRLMLIMFILNMWKLSRDGNSQTQFKATNFLDRGFRLFIKSVFDITIDAKHKSKSKSHDNDMECLERYFSDERIAVYFKYDFIELYKIFSNEKIIDDFRQIIRINDYVEEPFGNFNEFKNGFIRFLARRRLIGDINEYTFEYFIDKLKTDKFFKKLPNMSGNDSTRKNVYQFFTEIEENLVN